MSLPCFLFLPNTFEILSLFRSGSNVTFSASCLDGIKKFEYRPHAVEFFVWTLKLKSLIRIAVLHQKSVSSLLCGFSVVVSLKGIQSSGSAV
jgi:hypothetical protein